MTAPNLLARIYLPVLAAIAVIGVAIIFIVGFIHLWPYALAGAAVLLIGLVIPMILGVADTQLAEGVLPTRSEIACAALGIIFSTSAVTTLFSWWLLIR